VSGNALAANGDQAAATGRLAAARRTIGDSSALRRGPLSLGVAGIVVAMAAALVPM